jgi:CBS domain-containing protein
MSRTVSTLMQQRVHAVGMDDGVADVERLFAEHGLSWAPVLDTGGAVLGVISAFDLVRYRAQGGAGAAPRAWQLCTYKPIVVDPDAPLADVARRMVEREIHHVVVMRGAQLAGVVSSLDFVKTFIDPTGANP